jgi:hypothetical protein
LLFIGERRDLMQCLIQALLNLPLLKIQTPLDLTPDAQLKHGGRHTREALRAVPHAYDDILLAFIQRAQCLG